MNHIRRSLHKHHICPLVRLGGPTQIAALSVALGKKSDGHATSHALPYKSWECQQFCEAMGEYVGRELNYYGEPQYIVSQRAMCELMKPPKRPNVKNSRRNIHPQSTEQRRCSLWRLADQRHRSL